MFLKVAYKVSMKMGLKFKKKLKVLDITSLSLTLYPFLEMGWDRVGFESEDGSGDESDPMTWA